jgi:peptidoglycan/LPS O-acetylase OafA/YrhL
MADGQEVHVTADATINVADDVSVNITNSSDNEPQKTLFVRHWDQSLFISKERMWVTGLYAAALGLASTKMRDASFAPVIYLFLFGMGVWGLVFVLKLNFLYELHIRKAQRYVAGEELGVITDFMESSEGLQSRNKFMNFCGKASSISFSFSLFFCVAPLFSLTLYLRKQFDINMFLLILGGVVLSIVSGFFVYKFNGKRFNIARTLSSQNLSKKWPSL